MWCVYSFCVNKGVSSSSYVLVAITVYCVSESILWVCACVRVHVYVRVSVYMCVRVCVCVYVCVFVHLTVTHCRIPWQGDESNMISR